MKRGIIAVCVLLALGAGAHYGWRWYSGGNDKPRYKTAKVAMGAISQTVKTTGIIQPIFKIAVGTQVTGIVQKLLVDFNSRVKAGDIVAQIDPSVYDARVKQDEASLSQSRANLEATQAKLSQAEKELARAQALKKQDLIAQADLDTAQANRDVLAAQIKVDEASIKQSEASLSMSRANLGYTIIRSPVDGIVVSRDVDEGQTVIANMTVQSIFDIATDLKKIQVQASVPEADIGKIKKDQRATFTVDAFDDEFRGTVDTVRINPVTVQNVVTYTVIVNADNPEEKLFPGMTANLSFLIAKQENTLKVPNTALRFKPPAADSEKGKDSENREPRDRKSVKTPKTVRNGTLWRETNGKLSSTVVTLGITDGTSTEITGGDIHDGDTVITSFSDSAVAANAQVNPFTPQMPGRGPR